MFTGLLARVSLRATKSTQEVVNTFHYGTAGPVAAGDVDDYLQEIATDFRDAVLASYRAFFPADWTVGPIVATQELDPLSPQAARQQRQAVPAAGAGTLVMAGDEGPYSITCLVHQRTAFVGRRFTGRLWMPPPFDETTGASGMFVAGSSYITRVNTFLAAVPASIAIAAGGGGALADHVVYSRTARALNAAQYTAPVTSHEVDMMIRWLRSRQLGN